MPRIQNNAAQSPKSDIPPRPPNTTKSVGGRQWQHLRTSNTRTARLTLKPMLIAGAVLTMLGIAAVYSSKMSLPQENPLQPPADSLTTNKSINTSKNTSPFDIASQCPLFIQEANDEDNLPPADKPPEDLPPSQQLQEEPATPAVPNNDEDNLPPADKPSEDLPPSQQLQEGPATPAVPNPVISQTQLSYDEFLEHIADSESTESSATESLLLGWVDTDPKLAAQAIKKCISQERYEDTTPLILKTMLKGSEEQVKAALQMLDSCIGSPDKKLSYFVERWFSETGNNKVPFLKRLLKDPQHHWKSLISRSSNSLFGHGWYQCNIAEFIDKEVSKSPNKKEEFIALIERCTEQDANTYHKCHDIMHVVCGYRKDYLDENLRQRVSAKCPQARSGYTSLSVFTGNC